MRPDLPEAGKRMWQLYDELEGTVERVAAGARQGVEDAARSVVTLGARGAAFVGREYGRTQARFDCVYTTCEDARSRAKTELVQRFRDIELGQVVDGLLDGLEQMLVTILGCTTGGAVVGGALGAFAWGIGAVPGAAIGASAGLQVGVFALKVMGLAAIVEYVVHALPDALALYKKGLREAWDAPQDPLSGVDRPDHARILHVKAATWLIAEGHVRMVVIILMGIVACLLAKADTAALAKSMEGGSLGEDFSGWVVRNGGKLKARPDLQPRPSRILRPADEGRLPEREATPGSAVKEQPLTAIKDGPSTFLPKKYGELEPGAVERTPELTAQMKEAATRTAMSADGYPTLPEEAARTFGATPRPWDGNQVSGPIGRVIDADSNPAGSFWFEGKPPATEAEWRSGSAVLNNWNGDGSYVSANPADLKGWIGPAAPQLASDGVHVLPGGQDQIWIPRENATPSAPIPTPWNPGQ